MASIYHLLISRPLLNILVFFYNTIAFQDLGVSIVLLTIFIRLLLFPLFQKSIRYQLAMQAIQPKMKEIQEKHKEDKKKQTEAMMALYQEHNLNPFSGFLFLIIQIPILIGLYRIFLTTVNGATLQGLYSFIAVPAALHTSFLGLINLSGKNIIMVVAAACLQYFQGKLSLVPHKGHAQTDAEKMGRRMVLIGPLITIFIFWQLPAAIALYWCITSLFSIIQQLLVNKEFSHGTLGDIHTKDS